MTAMPLSILWLSIAEQRQEIDNGAKAGIRELNSPLFDVVYEDGSQRSNRRVRAVCTFGKVSNPHGGWGVRANMARLIS